MQMADSGSENEWIKRAKQGDEDAFAYLVEAYQVPVYNLCHRMLNDPAEAEDAAQEAFLKAYRGMGRYDPQRSFATWLLSIASHHCIDRIRKRRIFTLSFDDLLPSQEKPDPTPGPEASLTMHEHQDDVRELLQHLRTRDRAAVVLRYWYDMSYEEIAQSLSMTVSAVKSRLHRARREMASQWMEHEITTLTIKGRRDEASAI
jgi:RNA polymerase sigma-70 factor (ECF subfamily)